MLPVDGSTLIKFDVDLTVDYYTDTPYVSSFPAEIQKVLLPGMTYQFDFTLTFYGILKPTDLTLAVKEYNTITLNTEIWERDRYAFPDHRFEETDKVIIAIWME